MRGDPGATTFTRDGNEEPHAFVREDNDRLYVCFFDTRIGSWRWVDQGLPPNARVASSPAAIASIQVDNPLMRFLHAFVTGNNGRLFENFWNGTTWSWTAHGNPPNASNLLTPSVVTYRRTHTIDDESRPDGNDQLYVFCWGSDDLLYRFWQDAAQWRVGGRLPFPTSVVASEPVCIRHDPNQVSYIYTYVVGSDRRLYANFSMDLLASDWMWRDLGQPDSDTTVTRNIRPALASFRGELFAFVRGSNGSIWAHRWLGWRQGGPGTWVDLGKPPGTTVSGPSSVVGYNHEGTEFMYVFVRGADERLYVHRWDGGRSNLWAGFGRPTTSGVDVPASPDGGNARVLSAPGALTARFETTNRIYAFVRADDDHLHVCFWNGVDTWFWTDLGTPSQAPIRLSFSPTSLNFGSVPIGATRTRTLTIGNSSGVRVTASISASRPGSPFDWPDFTAVLAPGDQRAVAVTFTPNAQGDAPPETLTVTSDAEGSPHLISLKGRGIGDIPV